VRPREALAALSSRLFAKRGDIRIKLRQFSEPFLFLIKSIFSFSIEQEASSLDAYGRWGEQEIDLGNNRVI
jgi:hypothetical protein